MVVSEQNQRIIDENNQLRTKVNDCQALNHELEGKLAQYMYENKMNASRVAEALNRSRASNYSNSVPDRGPSYSPLPNRSLSPIIDQKEYEIPVGQTHSRSPPKPATISGQGTQSPLRR